LSIVEKTEATAQLLAFLASQRGHSGIIYCLSRKRVDELAAKLSAEGWPALPYHAGLDASTRARNQNEFIHGDQVIMVATIAFGMGIDKPDVRFVAHMDLPKSMEGYYQEIGRAGRDGEPAQAWMCYGLADLIQLKRFIEESNADEARKRYERSQLDALLSYAETLSCRRTVLLHHFGEAFSGPCNSCDRCLQPVASIDATVLAQQLLSAMYRTGQRFGIVHLIKVLRGESSENITRFGHEKLSVYGIGKATTDASWRSLLRQLVARGFVEVDAEYGALKLTESCRAILRGEMPIQIQPPAPKPPKAGRRQRAQVSAVAPVGERLFEQLRLWRRMLADQHNVPPYVILSDRTLAGITAAKPRTLAELADVHGIGETKLQRYGAEILELVEAH
jgi:ATP-dependent DNA helicase RecQ